MKEIYCGIDCSKNEHKIYISGESKAFTVKNTHTLCTKLTKMLKKKKVKQVIFESTGGYENVLANVLRENGIAYSRINPYKVKAFARAKGILAKTDDIDSKVLCEFGEQMKPEPTKPVRDVIVKLRQYLTRRNQLVKIKTMEQNHMKSPLSDDESKASVLTVIKAIKEQIKAIDKAISSLIENDSELKAKNELLCSFNGVGPVLTATLFAFLPELGELSRKQIASLVGVAPYNNDSGLVEYRHRSIHGGRRCIRDVLYMSALSSIRSNPMMRRSYKNLRSRGKLHKVAIVACMRKELIALNAMIRDNKPWDTERFSLSKQDYNKNQESKKTD